MSIAWIEVQTTVGRPLTTEERAQSEMWIGDARRIISNRLGDLAALDQGDLDMVVREAVATRIKHPDPTKKVAVSVDDGQVSKEYETATGQIEITDAWWDLLTPGQTVSGGAFSIHSARAPRSHRHAW